ncbi:MAG: xanthine dehydrogenase family protein molybdopterin-binding subunit [Chloroflexi bacterium]|nr:xanthine dehydrogenase family protein molybdopterin-binding subunit [Chloroflexota bacterium]
MVATHDPKNFKVVGTRPIRHDGFDKVTGRAQYGADIRIPGLIWGEVLRSPHAHARIKSIDTSAAEAMAGVLAAVTHADFPTLEDRTIEAGEGTVNFITHSQNVLADKKVHYKGHVVAAVAAIDHNTALEAVQKIKVEYETLPTVNSVEEALAPDAPIVFEDLVGDDLGEEVKNTNMARHFRHEFGDPEKGFEDSSIVIERDFKMSMVHQGYIEPHNATALWTNDGRLTLWSSTQGAFGVRSQTAGLLNMDESQIKVNPVEIGGGFGGKTVVYLPPVAALLSRKAGRPVKLQMDRKSVFEGSGPAPGGTLRVKIGVDGSGMIKAATATMKFEAGGFPGSSIGAAAICIFSPYTIENIRIDGYDVVTNKPKSAAYRAPGSPQAAFACESVVDEICEAGGWDKLEFRLKNASKEGTRRADGPIIPRLGMEETLQAAMDSDHWNTPLVKQGPNGKLRGRGVASGFWMNGAGKSSVTLALDADGVVMMSEGSADIGGTRASIAMQAAEVLGIAAEDVHPSIPDTDSIGFTGVTGGSRTTHATGYAAYNAAQSMIEQLKERASMLWGIDPDSVQFEDGVFSSASDPELNLSFKQLAARLDETGGPVTAAESVNLSSAGNATATHIVDLEIDPETGKTDVIRYTAVQDVGKAVHPAYAEGQVEGGAVQGMGWALNEEYFMNDDGEMQNSSFLDYRMPTSLDMPMIETILVEVPSPFHPFGVRGVGEVPLAPPLAAARNAIHDALGIYLYETPMNPRRIMDGLNEKNG